MRTNFSVSWLFPGAGVTGRTSQFEMGYFVWQTIVPTTVRTPGQVPGSKLGPDASFRLFRAINHTSKGVSCQRGLRDPRHRSGSLLSSLGTYCNGQTYGAVPVHYRTLNRITSIGLLNAVLAVISLPKQFLNLRPPLRRELRLFDYMPRVYI